MTLLTDDDLGRLLSETGDAIEVPAYVPVRDSAPMRTPHRLNSRGKLALVAAAVVVSFGVAAVSVTGGGGGGASTTSATSGASSSDGSRAESGSGSNESLAASVPASGAAGLAAPSAAPDRTFNAPGASTFQSESGRLPDGATGAQQGDQGRIVKTGTVALIAGSGKVTPTLDNVGRVAREQGGSVFATETQESSDTPSGTITVRVPVAQFDALVSAVRNLAEVRSVQTSGREVTAEYADLETRIASATAARNRLTTILGAAVSVAEVLAVQQQIDQTSATVDQLTGQLTVLKDQSDLSTLTVAVTQSGDPAITGTQSGEGFGHAFTRAGNGFSSGLQSLVAASGRALLVLLCLVALSLVGWGVYKVGRRRLV